MLDYKISAILFFTMEKTELTTRDTKAKKPAVLLKEGLTPAVVYNAKTESKSVMLDSAVARKLVKNSTTATVLDISLDGKDIKAAGLVMASDGFFPFSDCVESAAEYGIKAIVQPGGSVRDAESIEAANAHQITMLFSGMRHFKH